MQGAQAAAAASGGAGGWRQSTSVRPASQPACSSAITLRLPRCIAGGGCREAGAAQAGVPQGMRVLERDWCAAACPDGTGDAGRCSEAATGRMQYAAATVWACPARVSRSRPAKPAWFRCPLCLTHTASPVVHVGSSGCTVGTRSSELHSQTRAWRLLAACGQLPLPVHSCQGMRALASRPVALPSPLLRHGTAPQRARHLCRSNYRWSADGGWPGRRAELRQSPRSAAGSKCARVAAGGAC